MRLTTVLLAGLVAFAGAVPSTPTSGERPNGAPVPRYAFPAIKGFDGLTPTLPPTSVTERQERGTVMTRAIPLPVSRSEHPVTRAGLDRAGVLVAAYRSAVAASPTSCNLPVSLLAAIGQIESGSAGGRQIGADHVVRPGIFGPLLDGGPFATIPDSDHGRIDGNSTWDRAVGPMQFIPSTWARSGVDGDGDGRADPQNVYDAAWSAAGYLCNYGRDLSVPAELRAAIYAYNQSDAYVLAVLEWMRYFDGKGLQAVSSVDFTVASGGRASQLPVPQSSATSLSPSSTTGATTSPTAARTTPAPVTTTPSTATTGTATPSSTTGTTTTGTTSAPTTTSSPTTSSPTTTPSTTQTPGTSTTSCPSPTTTVTVTPSPTTTTPTPTTTTTSPSPSPTTCSATATVTPTETTTTGTATTTATEGPTSP